MHCPELLDFTAFWPLSKFFQGLKDDSDQEEVVRAWNARVQEDVVSCRAL